MSKTNNFRNSIQLVGVIFGGLLISLPVVPTANAQQQPTTQLNRQANPCPSIFYEEPHNSRVLVPTGCRANAFTSRTNAQSLNSNSVGATPSSQQTQLGVGSEVSYNSSGSTSQNYNSQNGNQSSMTQQSTVAPSPQPLNYPNRGIPNSQIDSNTGNRVNGPAGGYSNQRQSSRDSQSYSSDQSGNQSSMMQGNRSNSSTNRGIPNSQIDSNTGNRVNGPAGGYSNQRQSSRDSQSYSSDQSGNQSSMMQGNRSNSSTNRGIPNSQIDSNTGNRVNGPAGGYSNQRQSSRDSQTNSTRYLNAIAAVSPTAGKVNVRLVNKTNATIVYQVIGDTQLRTLAGRSEIMLQGLRTPTNVAFYRQDQGFLMVTPQASSQNGMLNVTLQETIDFAMDRTSMRIENNGSVYLN